MTGRGYEFIYDIEVEVSKDNYVMAGYHDIERRLSWERNWLAKIRDVLGGIRYWIVDPQKE